MGWMSGYEDDLLYKHGYDGAYTSADNEAGKIEGAAVDGVPVPTDFDVMHVVLGGGHLLTVEKPDQTYTSANRASTIATTTAVVTIVLEWNDH